jgi:hypothetical protein
MSLEDAIRLVKRRWRTLDERIDEETGEVHRTRESIGMVCVEFARERMGVATYCAKYLTKGWPAVPEWMGESYRRFRKLGISSGMYDVLERLHRHHRRRGSRPEVKHRHLRRRTLFKRMAASCASCLAFQKLGGRLLYCGTVAVPAVRLGVVVDRYAGRAVRLGRFPSCRVALSAEAFKRLRRDGEYWERERERVISARLAEVREAWAEMQGGRYDADEVDGGRRDSGSDGSVARRSVDRGQAHGPGAGRPIGVRGRCLGGPGPQRVGGGDLRAGESVSDGS